MQQVKHPVFWNADFKTDFLYLIWNMNVQMYKH